MMTTFWPRVGKQEIECFHRVGGQQITHRVKALYLQEANVAQTSGFARGTANSPEQSFDPKKVFVRQSLRQRAKEGTVAAAKIDVQWRFAVECLFETDFIRQQIRRLRDHSRTNVPAVS